MPEMTRFILLTLIASLVTASKPERWGGLPETIDVGRSISLNTEPGLPFDESHSPWVEQVGLHPKVYVFHNFLTPMERAHMGMFIRRCSDPIIERIERRISLYTHIPMSHQEDIQVLRYTNNQSYGAHFDSGDKSEPGPHQRLATFLMYLSDVEEGGETAFPQGSKWIDPSIPRKLEEAGVKLSACAQGHVAYKPKAGDAVLFYSFHPNGRASSGLLLSGSTPTSADWEYLQHAKPNRVEYPAEPGQCDDAHPQCKQWAAAGECAKNHGYMMGDAGGGGACRKSCGACRVCLGSSDLSCINDNRSKAGYLPLVRSEMEWLGVPWWLGEEPSPEL
ncbi:Fe2OG dioxygenase domain-containing protein, partial [Haematococcus lacustris]